MRVQSDCRERVGAVEAYDVSGPGTGHFVWNGSRVSLALITTAMIVLACCTPAQDCVVIEDADLKTELLDAVRADVEYDVVEDNYRHTLEKELSLNKVGISDCGRTYKVRFTPFSRDPDLIAIGTTKKYTLSKRGLAILAVAEE